ncbi:TetR/AcrR family transcriptional regulator [Amycolatopsis acidicola]|uniref:TetR/AcrR family transcriptional regulator n=1 Tax=Amycolatopsis acidicola TaxID=2596893 RepID=A0A5N0V5R7_9PSEU|nr:TetR/AcrR family transcriptional regulator [Amycolatopsis acidicola]KAA9160748.1 TetR/AcrR family transcriptional regulator [Amycolatopsis acidicola]
MNATEKRISAAAMRLFAERGSLDLTMSDLANEAQVARGTLYRNVQSVEHLFQKILEDLAVEIHAKNKGALDGANVQDPPARLATGIRLLVRQAHDNPSMGRFFVRFGLTDESLRGILTGPPMRDVHTGISTGRYTVPQSMELSIASLLSGATVSAMWMVLEGHQGWREAGSSAAELVLRALGIAADEASSIAAADLPAQPEG